MLFYLRILLFAIYLINGILAIPRNSVVYDEMDHWSYGKRILKGQPEKIYTYDDASAMPVTGLNAIPRAIEQVLSPNLKKTDGGFSDIMHGRYITLLVCLLTGLFIFSWSKELFGEPAGVFSLFLFVFCPNLNAHATILSTDAYTALFTIASFYYYWKFLKQPTWNYFILFSIVLGLSQLVKQSLTHLIFFFFLFSLVILVKRKTIFTNWKKNATRAFVIIAILLFLINVGFLFNNTGRTLAEFGFRSKTFHSLASSPVFNRIPLPVPAPYIEGLDLTQHMNELGAGHPDVSGQNYLLGNYKSGTGFWSYYLVIFIFKTPLPYIAVLLAVFYLLIRRKINLDNITAGLVLAGVLYFLVFFSLFNNVQIGLRHIILVYPLLYVLMGGIVTIKVSRKGGLLFLSIFIIYSMATFYSYFPNLVSYTNELILDKKNAYKIMADSNLEYGQGAFALERFLQKHPEIKIPGNVPAPGRYILGLNDYLDIHGRHTFDWLKETRPRGHVAHSYLLLDVEPENKK